MSDARSAILTTLRNRLRRGLVDPATEQFLEQHLTGSPGAPRPQVGDNLVDRFRRQAQKAAATFVRVGEAREIPAAVAGYLLSHGRMPRAVCGEDPFLLALPWTPQGVNVRLGTADGEDPVGLSRAELAVAETGSVVLLSGPASPTRINFLPETHIVVVEEQRVVPDLEAVWAHLRKKGLPRAVNFVTGPSRTADIEQTLQLGAHGPRHLHLILVP